HAAIETRKNNRLLQAGRWERSINSGTAQHIHGQLTGLGRDGGEVFFGVKLPGQGWRLGRKRLAWPGADTGYLRLGGRSFFYGPDWFAGDPVEHKEQPHFSALGHDIPLTAMVRYGQ